MGYSINCHGLLLLFLLLLLLLLLALFLLLLLLACGAGCGVASIFRRLWLAVCQAVQLESM